MQMTTAGSAASRVVIVLNFQNFNGEISPETTDPQFWP